MWDKMRLTFFFLLLLFIYRRLSTNNWTPSYYRQQEQQHKTSATSRRLHNPNPNKHGNDETSNSSSDFPKVKSTGNNAATLEESLSAVASTLLMNEQNSLEVSSERDVFVNDDKSSSNNNKDSPEEESPEGNSSEESSSDNNVTSSPEDFKEDDDDDDEEDDIVLEENNPRQKSDAVTTPQGLTTWSGNYPPDITVSSTSLQFADKEKQQEGAGGVAASSPLRTTLFSAFTTEIPRTTKSAVVAKTKPTTGTKVRKPYNKTKKVVSPTRFVKPALEEVTAEAVGTDGTHNIYKITTNNDQNKQESKEGSNSNNRNPYGTTKRPVSWPYQMTTRRVSALPAAPKRPPPPFTHPYPKKPKPAMGVKRPSSSMSSSSMSMSSTSSVAATTTPTPTTTVYNRIPGPLMYPFPSISFTNLGFMDFLRSQILPRIGLSLISFMAASPLILSMIGANAIGRRRRRRRRSVESRNSFSSNNNFDFDYDFSALEKKFKSMQSESRNEWPLLTKAVDFLIHKFSSKFLQKKLSSS